MLPHLQAVFPCEAENAPPANQSSTDQAREVTTPEALDANATSEAESEENAANLARRLFDSPVYEPLWATSNEVQEEAAASEFHEDLNVYEALHAPMEAPDHSRCYFDETTSKCFYNAGPSCPNIPESIPLERTMVPLEKLLLDHGQGSGGRSNEATISTDIRSESPPEGIMSSENDGSGGRSNEATTSTDICTESPPVESMNYENDGSGGRCNGATTSTDICESPPAEGMNFGNDGSGGRSNEATASTEICESEPLESMNYENDGSGGRSNEAATSTDICVTPPVESMNYANDGSGGRSNEAATSTDICESPPVESMNFENDGSGGSSEATTSTDIRESPPLESMTSENDGSGGSNDSAPTTGDGQLRGRLRRTLEPKQVLQGLVLGVFLLLFIHSLQSIPRQ